MSKQQTSAIDSFQATLNAARQSGYSSGYLDGVNAYAEAIELFVLPAVNAEKLLQRIHVDIVATLTSKHGFIEGALLDVLRDKLRVLAAALNDADIVNRSWLERFGSLGLSVQPFLETREILADELAQGKTRIDANMLFQRVSGSFANEVVQDRLAVIREALKPGRTPDSMITVITDRAWQLKDADPTLEWKRIGALIIDELARTGAHPGALEILQYEQERGTLGNYLKRNANTRKPRKRKGVV